MGAGRGGRGAHGPRGTSGWCWTLRAACSRRRSGAQRWCPREPTGKHSTASFITNLELLTHTTLGAIHPATHRGRGSLTSFRCRTQCTGTLGGTPRTPRRWWWRSAGCTSPARRASPPRWVGSSGPGSKGWAPGCPPRSGSPAWAHTQKSRRKDGHRTQDPQRRWVAAVEGSGLSMLRVWRVRQHGGGG
jgi:hypothetical protein